MSSELMSAGDFVFRINGWGWVLIWLSATLGFVIGWVLCFRLRAGQAETAGDLGAIGIETSTVYAPALREHLLACLRDAGTGASHWGQSPEFRHLATMAGVPLPEAHAEPQRQADRPAPQSAGTEETPGMDDFPQPLTVR